MSDHQQPCAELQVTKNEVSHLSEKIGELHEDVKSYMGTVSAGQENTSELLRTNVNEQREIRADILKSNEIMKVQIESLLKISDERQESFETYKEEQKEIKQEYDRKMFWYDTRVWGIVVFILLMCVGTVWRVGNVTAKADGEKKEIVTTRK